MTRRLNEEGRGSADESHALDADGRYRGLDVILHRVEAGGESIELFGLRDAADLLDEADFGARFLEEDVAPYGMELWPAATMLARYVAARSHSIADSGPKKRMLEIGAGLGLISILAARLGWDVTASDHEPASLAFARRNAAHNGVSLQVTHLDWHKPPTGLRFPVIVASDVLYELRDHAGLISCLKTCLSPDGEAWIADPNRGVADRFETLAVSHGFGVKVESSRAINRGGEPVAGRIFVLRRG